MRIFLQRADFSRNVESSEAGRADLSIQWQLHPGWKTTASPAPSKKVRLYQEKMGKDLPGEKSWAPRKCRDDWLHRNRKAHGRHRSQQITSIFSSIHVLSCQSESSGLFSIIWVTTQEAGCPFFILTATEDKRSQRKELKEAFHTNAGGIEGFLLYTSSNALEQLAKQFFNN